MFKNGNWYHTQKCITTRIVRNAQSFYYFQKYRITNLPKQKTEALWYLSVSDAKLFFRNLGYACCSLDIELIHAKFLRFIFCVKKSTNSSALYGELARTLFSVLRKINMIKYWTKILQQHTNSLLKQVYLMLKEDSDLNINYNGQN